MTAQTILTPLRLNLAREQLRQRLAQGAGIDPFSGWFISAMPDPDEISEERERRMSYLDTGAALPGETIAYLQTVGGLQSDTTTSAVEPPREALFAVRYPATNQSASTDRTPSPSSLFVARHDDR
jgi:hypothetical protein